MYLLMEVQEAPEFKEADRIHEILDYVFGKAYGITLWQRSRDILGLVNRRLEIFLHDRDIPKRRPVIEGTDVDRTTGISQADPGTTDVADDTTIWSVDPLFAV